MISPDPFVLTTATNESIESIDENHAPNIYYTVSEVLVALFAVVGNALVITVFCKERRLRRRTNYYIVSLAAADLLVGLLGIPFALLAAVGLPKNLYACLFTISLLVVLCTISIFCLVAVSVDRYWAILYPMGYSRHVRTKTALVIISICWVAGTFIGFLPLMGWHQDVPSDVECFFLKVMDYNYLVFLYIVTIITPSVVLAAFYAHIYRVVLKQMRRIVTMNPLGGSSNRSSGGTMLRMLGAAQKREVKATQNLSIIVLFFMICWIPLYTINFILAFCAECFEVNSTFMLFCIILSHVNSAGNPLLYAYHLKDFRAALKYFFCKLFTFGEGNSSSGRPSYGSNAQNNYVQNRLQSLRDNRSVGSLTMHTKYLSNSQLSLAGKLQSRSCSLTERPKLGSIIAQTAVLAAATAGDNAREMWRISEHPSFSEEQSKDYSFHECHVNNSNRIGSDKSERLNNGRVDIPLDEGEDEVFLDDTAHNTNVSNEYELASSSSESTISNSRLPNIMTPLNKIKAKCFSSSSPQLTRGLFIVEAEITKEGKRKKFTRSVSDEKKVTKTFSFSGDFLHSPVKSLKLSPLKAVGEFLLHHGVKRSRSANKLNLNNDNDVVVTKQFSRKENGITVN